MTKVDLMQKATWSLASGTLHPNCLQAFQGYLSLTSHSLQDARLDASNNDDMRFIRVRPVRANSCPTEDELVDAEWHSLVESW
jgi:hypothetical protein